VKRSLVAARVFLLPTIPLVFFGVTLRQWPALAVAQSGASDDVKHDTPGQLIKPGQSVHIDVDLALVNVTFTDPYDRLVTGLEPDNFRIFENSPFRSALSSTLAVAWPIKSIKPGKPPRSF
jgi:hypothetical protein